VSDFLALVGIIVAIVLGLGAIGATIFVYRKQSPRREFTYSVEASPLVSTQVRGLDKLSVAFDGVPLSHPYLVTVNVASTGRADIASSSFDGGKPILFDLNVPVLAQLGHKTSTDTVGARLRFAEGDTAIALDPSLLPKRYRIRAAYLCDGEPHVVPRIELADISIREESRPTVYRAVARSQRAALVTATSSAIVAALATVFSWIISQQIQR